MSANGRRWMLWTTLALTLAATGWVSSREDAANPSADRLAPGRQGEPRKTPPQAEQGAKSRPALQRTKDVSLESLLELPQANAKRSALDDPPGEMFPSRTWQPPPAPPPRQAVAIAQPPRAPPLPFSYFGQMILDGKATVFLARGNRDYAVSQGEIIEGAYRVDEIRHGAMVMTYLPLDERQTLAIGSAQ